MTWSERRIVSFLSAVVLLLALAVVVVLSFRYRTALEKKETSSDQPAFSVSDDEAAPPPFIALTYDNGSTTLSFSLNESGRWVWSDDISFPLDDTTLSTILQQLLSWSPLEVITDTETLENAGLDQPSGSLTATTGDNMITTLLFGKTTAEGNLYVRLNGDTSSVYVIGTELFELMEVPIYDMCILPQLPSLPEADILSIGISGANRDDGSMGLATVITSQQTEEDATSWRCDGGNVSSLPALRDLLKDLESLSFERCVIYRPSQEALSICGFDNPTRLTVSYRIDNDDSAILLLTIGAPLPDGSGRYVRLGEDSTIYLLPSATLDPLMHISVNGLDG